MPSAEVATGCPCIATGRWVSCGDAWGGGGTSIVRPNRFDRLATGSDEGFSSERGDTTGLGSFAPGFSECALFSTLIFKLPRPRTGPRGARAFGDALGAGGAAGGAD